MWSKFMDVKSGYTAQMLREFLGDFRFGSRIEPRSRKALPYSFPPIRQNRLL